MTSPAALCPAQRSHAGGKEVEVEGVMLPDEAGSRAGAAHRTCAGGPMAWW